ncbi:hypothetical protein PCL_03773 [Purpureocillium lilacinum]|uniref:Uncharacterized protein n=1 Tax=Purpureocillium lilacinum TaxID=33203 RepID=A0A2U3EQ09_PURLI|nr:hypothetical protein PCL_03773 [Purpureocillium lilacinum]
MDPVSQIITRKEWHLALLRTWYTLGNPLQCYFSLMMLLPGISGHAEQTVPHHPVFALLESGPVLPCPNAQKYASTGRLLLCRTAGGSSRSRSDLPLSTSAEQITRRPDSRARPACWIAARLGRVAPKGGNDRDPAEDTGQLKA